MPTYDYKCDACGATFELFQSITAAPIKKCPQCKKAKARRLIGTGAGLIFKGSGFYITDYRSESYKSAAKSDGGTSSSTSSTPASNGASSNSPSTPPAAAPSTPSKTESKPAATSGDKGKK